MFKYIIIGGGGHTKVLLDALNSNDILGITEINENNFYNQYDLPILGNDDVIDEYDPAEVRLIIGVGSASSTAKRQKLFKLFKSKGYSFHTVIHPHAYISPSSDILEGAQIMAGAVIQPGSSIGRNTIVNTKVAIDHDCIIGDHVHLAPGVTLSGAVQIGEGTHIGTGTIAIQGIQVGRGCLIGAGSMLLRNIPDNSKAWGSPAKIIER